ncbi:MAG: hypothetical protein ABF586_10440 [Sporolactobacillus sp.]
MNTKAKKHLIDDYLDLYRLANQMADEEWKNELRGKLIAILEGRDLFGEQKRALQQQFIEVNRLILTLFQQIHRGEAEDQKLSLKLFALKQRRKELRREIAQMKSLS